MEDPSTKFVVPVHTADIELPTADRFCVQSVMDVGGASQEDLQAVLQALASKLRSAHIEGIMDNAVFDPVYSLLRHFPSLSSANKSRLIKLVCDTVSRGVAFLSTTPAGDPSQHADGDSTTRFPPLVKNAFKALCFLLNTAVMVGERNTVAAGGTKSRRSKKSKADATVGGANSFPAWDDLLPKCLQTLATAIDVNFARLWPVGVPEEEFVGLFVKSALRVMEQSANTRSGSATRTAVVQLLAMTVHKFPVVVASLAASVVHMLTTLEHVAPVLAEVMATLGNKYNSSQLVGDVLRDVGRINTNDAKDSSGIRSVAAFLPALAEVLPQAVLANISVLLPHLDGEAYAMRSALVTAIGHVVAAESVSDDTKHAAASSASPAGDGDDAEDDDDGEGRRANNPHRTRDMLLDILQERVYDTNAYTRAAAQRTFTQLVVGGRLPLSRVHAVAALAADRLRDRAAVVRKAAMQCISSLLERNPFGGTLDVAVYQGQLDVINAWLEEHGPAKPKQAGRGPAPIPEGDEDDGETDGETDAGGEEETKGSSGEEDAAAELTTEQQRHLKAQSFCRAAIKFAEQMGAAIPIIGQLMGSKIISDVLESMSFLSRARSFGLAEAETGLRKMLALVWSHEKAVRERVLATFKDLYIDQAGSNGRHRQPPQQVAHNLVALAAGSTLAERTSLEEVIRFTALAGHLPKPALRCLWDMVEPEETSTATGDELQSAIAHSRIAMNLLSMVAAAKPSIIYTPSRLADLCDRVFGGAAAARQDYRLMRHACVALQRVPALADAPSSAHRDAMQRALTCVLDTITTAKDHSRFWFSVAEQGINALFALAPHPEAHAATIVRALAASAFPTTNGSAVEPSLAASTTDLSRLYFCLGHVAVKLVVHIEGLGTALKKAQAAAENAAAARGEKATKETIEVELGLAAGEEEQQSARLQAMEETEIVCKNLLGAFGPCIVHSVMVALAGDAQHSATVAAEGEEPVATASPLTQSSVLALCKFMSISAAFCEANLQVLFTLLEKAAAPALRSMVVVALGDLAFRFPNLVEPWIGRVYDRLNDTNASVRKTTLMVLTHLILNDMVKIRGHGAKVALCLQDSEPRIRDLTQLFFSELSKRGNSPIYNLLPDTLASLAADDAVDSGTFRTIMRFLLAFVNKDKHAESLMDKLCHRFQTTGDPKQWRGLAFCLGLLRLTERGAKRLADNLRMYKHAITDEEVHAAFQTLITKAKKFTKQETKDAVEEWQRSFDAAHAGQSEQDGVAKRSARVSGIAKHAIGTPGGDGGEDGAGVGAGGPEATAGRTKTRGKARKSAAGKRKPKGRASRRVVYDSTDDEEEDAGDWSGGEDGDSVDSDGEQEPVGKENAPAKGKHRTAGRSGRRSLRQVQ